MLCEVVYDGELSATAYIILFSALLIIVGGLSWCFYRAIKAGGGSAEPQEPENGSDQS
jgi:uncharacterized membrane protein